MTKAKKFRTRLDCFQIDAALGGKAKTRAVLFFAIWEKSKQGLSRVLVWVRWQARKSFKENAKKVVRLFLAFNNLLHFWAGVWAAWYGGITIFPAKFTALSGLMRANTA